MKTLVTVLLFVLWSFQLGHSLECFSCTTGFCLIPSKTACGLLESCISYTYTAAGLSLKKKGCGNSTECDTDDFETNVGAIMKTRHYCCDTDLCNSAITSRLSAVTGIAVLVALWLFKLS
ncbi:CD59 glycoprotein-like [Pelobates fuscus]|uniref:CD59 glycoprotein-like n=1 Tax=Pelobates fuscus TaxID=191477 RepID=UPI002FE4C5AB